MTSGAELAKSRTTIRLAATALLSSLLLAANAPSEPALAGCISTPIAGGEQWDCTDAPPNPTVVPIGIPAGDNQLNVYSGTFDSFEFLGNGTSTTAIRGGHITAGVESHDGVDAFTITDGTIDGTVSQGDGIDSFVMHGGTVGSVAQGGGLDTFLMTGGTITGAFVDGDFATVTGGVIGSVNLNIGNNVFDMSGGAIVGSVVAFGNDDTFSLSGGDIGGLVNMGNGDNSLTVSGGSIGGGMLTGNGTDTLSWSGGVVVGTIALGDGNDEAVLSGLGNSELALLETLDAGAGTDNLKISGSIVASSSPFVNWEAITLTSGTRLTLDNDLILGDSGTLTGTLTIDASSTLFAGKGNFAVAPNTGGQLVALTNAGLIDLQSESVGDSLTIVGNYVGQGGRLAIDTQLGADRSPSDRLIIDSGAGTGTSLLSVNNVGGLGDLTHLNGILVVDAINSGTTGPGLFALAGPVVAGPYEYSLYRGSVDGSNPEAWYLRSNLDCSLDHSASVCGPDWRQEVSLYAAIPAMTLLYGRLMLDTLHERRGDAMGGAAAGYPDAAWGRVIGQHGDRDGATDGAYGAGPKYDYDFWAFQGGADLYRDGDAATSRNRAGAFFAIGNGSGDVDNFDHVKAGENSFMAYSWGGYWTHYTPDNAYIDALLLGTWYDIDAKSTRIPKMKTHGAGFGASIEGGYPFAFAGGFRIEPQAQLAYQTVNLDGASDIAANVQFSDVNSLAGRLGVRFAQDFGAPSWLTGGPGTFTAWVRPNFWYEFLGDPKTSFSSETGFIPFAAKIGGTTFEINTGFSTEVAEGTAIYANASYLVGISENADGNAYDGKLGVKVAW